MAVKGLDIFKLSPKKNCKECGSPTCMAFCMKVAQGAVPITKCPYMSEEDMPEWGSQEERGIEMEITTAAAVLAGGSDAVILRHPEAVKTVAKMIDALM